MSHSSKWSNSRKELCVARQSETQVTTWTSDWCLKWRGGAVLWYWALTFGIWCYFLVDSVRIELNHRDNQLVSTPHIWWPGYRSVSVEGKINLSCKKVPGPDGVIDFVYWYHTIMKWIILMLMQEDHILKDILSHDRRVHPCILTFMIQVDAPWFTGGYVLINSWSVETIVIQKYI